MTRGRGCCHLRYNLMTSNKRKRKEQGIVERRTKDYRTEEKD